MSSLLSRWYVGVFASCLWVHAAAEVLVVVAMENTSVSLTCTAQRKPDVDYYAVRWYKEGASSSLTGLLSSTPPGGRLRYYVDADTRISLELPSLSLRLPPVTCSDAGVYQCYMAAPVGEQNREGRVRLSIAGCPTDPPVILEPQVNILMEKTPLHSEPVPKESYLIICGSVGVLLSVFVIILLIYRNQRNALWQKTKALEKEPYPDPNCPPEKQDLLWIATLGPSPKKADITAA